MAEEVKIILEEPVELVEDLLELLEEQVRMVQLVEGVEHK